MAIMPPNPPEELMYRLSTVTSYQIMTVCKLSPTSPPIEITGIPAKMYLLAGEVRHTSFMWARKGKMTAASIVNHWKMLETKGAANEYW